MSTFVCSCLVDKESNRPIYSGNKNENMVQRCLEYDKKHIKYWVDFLFKFK